MNILLYLGIACVACSFASFPVYNLLLASYVPQRYALLKSQGRYRGFPDTWEEFYRLWRKPLSDFEREITQLSEMEPRHILYTRFVDQKLMPFPIAFVAMWLLLFGILLLLAWGISLLF